MKSGLSVIHNVKVPALGPEFFFPKFLTFGNCLKHVKTVDPAEITMHGHALVIQRDLTNLFATSYAFETLISSTRA